MGVQFSLASSGIGFSSPGRPIAGVGAIALLLLPFNVWATTLNVPADYVTIQAAIDAAMPGDEVVIADGVYTGPGNKDLDFHGKAITVSSASGDPATCVIDCENSGRGFYFHSGETVTSVVSGVTVRYGNANFGAGVLCQGASPTLTCCTITDNSATGTSFESGGGGVYSHSASPTLVECTITANTASYSGGGVRCNRSSPTLTDCTIARNTADNLGGGIDCYYDSAPTVTRCMIAENSAGSLGGGLCSDFSPTLIDCTITANAAGHSGGGLACFADGCVTFAGRAIPGDTSEGERSSRPEPSTELIRCTITHNVADDHGGGVIICGYSRCNLTDCTVKDNRAALGGGVSCFNARTALTNCNIAGNRAQSGGGMSCDRSRYSWLTNCTIMGNTASESGAGVFFDNSEARLINCTIADNAANGNGGAVYSDGYGPMFSNCILWANMPQQFFFASSHPDVTYCDVPGGWSGAGNISVDPLFIRNPSDGGDGWGDDPNTPDVDEGANDDFGDLRLLPGSLCIDAGNNNTVWDTMDLDGDGDPCEPLPFDMFGLSRFVDDPNTADAGYGTAPIVDMGPFERQRVGDLNCDGTVDFADINPFVQFLSNHSAWQATYPACDPRIGDINGDETYGQLSFGDINPFVALLLGP